MKSAKEIIETLVSQMEQCHIPQLVVWASERTSTETYFFEELSCNITKHIFSGEFDKKMVRNIKDFMLQNHDGSENIIMSIQRGKYSGTRDKVFVEFSHYEVV